MFKQINNRSKYRNNVRERHVFILSITFFLIAVPYYFIFKYVGAMQQSHVVLVVLSVFLLAMGFKRHYLFSGFILISNISLSLLYFGSAFGREVGAQLICFSLVSTCFSVYGIQHKRYLILSCFIPIICISILELSNYSLFPRFALTIYQIKYIYLCAIITTFLISISSLYFYFSFANHIQQITIDDMKMALGSYGLTPRESEIVYHAVKGKTNKQMASILFVEECTVKKHLSNIFKKLDISNRTQMVLVATNKQ